jgi:hypothetical protein
MTFRLNPEIAARKDCGCWIVGTGKGRAFLPCATHEPLVLAVCEGKGASASARQSFDDPKTLWQHERCGAIIKSDEKPLACYVVQGGCGYKRGPWLNLGGGAK